MDMRLTHLKTHKNGDATYDVQMDDEMKSFILNKYKRKRLSKKLLLTVIQDAIKKDEYDNQN